ncbi:tRNA epoxyqueuosine(34) reductase QueG [Candidatus Kryptobacter tengchongensis]|uniref:Epoxyqueuosine reductase n=1 Tax=Kryptobacter tengchongensis TaxID=1643429 RepID=A0A916LK58_KRYT1|nr:tRNA epoxyqueuosine(34) reductase QueG [Candidatus Kryptobacter tengchongensis]CUT03618.1 epoxyqueuosine reductase [Candidatus Kryptobacter tengchongensis]
MNKHELTEKIKRKGIELGFSKIGIAKVEKLEHEGIKLSEWLAKGYHADMKWMEKNFDKRTNPQNILPEAKSIIVVALNYFQKISPAKIDQGKISIYALGQDYHIVLKSKLEKLLNFIRELVPDVKAKIYTDTGPVMEKAWATRAGLGWIGKHTNLITKEFGSWLFLGEIICDIELEYDEPMADLCGKCTRCINACPTNAIVEPYVLDSTKCISYWTIEYKGKSFPEDISKKFGNLIFGCDICQDVCPWNLKFQKETDVLEFKAFDYNINPDLLNLSKLSEDEFKFLYKLSPLKRAKFLGFMRNVKNAIKNLVWQKLLNFDFKCAIFDLDGVVADTFKFHHQSWGEMCARFGHNLSDEEFKKIVFGRRGKESAKILFDGKITEEEAENIGVEVDRIFREIAVGKLRAVDGVIEFILTLKENGIKTGLATSAPDENVKLIFDELNLHGLFDIVVTSKDVKHGKPAPDIFILASEKLGCKPRECIVFEDSIAGLISAKNADMFAIGVETTLDKNELINYADISIKNFSEILENLKLNKKVKDATS